MPSTSNYQPQALASSFLFSIRLVTIRLQQGPFRTTARRLERSSNEVPVSPTVLQRPTLILNRNWQAINVATVARALVMLYSETARVVDPRDYALYNWDDWTRLIPDRHEPFVRAVNQRIRVPEVITLLRFDRLPTGSVSFSRRNVFKRDRYTCQYCGVQPGTDDLTIDHVLPRAQGGQSAWTNCVLACMDCNKR